MNDRPLIATTLLVGLVACQPDTETVAPGITSIDEESPSALTATIVHCGRLIDGISSEPKLDQTIVIVNGRIDTLTNEQAVVHDIDLSDYTCLPGLIDTHAHMVEGTDTADLSVYLTKEIHLYCRIN